MDLSQEQLRKVRAVRSPQELEELARAEGVTLTLEEAQAHFAKLHPPVGELADDELDSVAGGGCGGPKTITVSGKQLGVCCTLCGSDCWDFRYNAEPGSGGLAWAGPPETKDYWLCTVCRERKEYAGELMWVSLKPQDHALLPTVTITVSAKRK